MRKKIWLQFHLWTVALLAVLTVGNIVSALRPFTSQSHRARVHEDTPGSFRLSDTTATSTRSPASSSESQADTAQALKFALLPCEPALRLVVSDRVKNLRLQFDSCAGTDAVVSIRNATNGFEGTIFGEAGTSAMMNQDSNEIAGNFIEAGRPAPKTQGRRVASIAQARTTHSTTVSTDYISLAPGANEIQIQRSSRSQILKIERR